MSAFRRHFAVIAAAAALCGFAAAASAATATFDDIGSAGALPASYAGLDWSSGGWSFTDALQSPYTPHSGRFAAYTNWDTTDDSSLIRFDTPSSLQGAWFAGLGGATVTFELYYQGLLVATSATLDPSATPTYLSSGYTGAIDSLRIASPGHGSFVMDNLGYTAIAPVPEPQTYALMLAGIGIVFIAVRRRSRTQD